MCILKPRSHSSTKMMVVVVLAVCDAGRLHHTNNTYTFISSSPYTQTHNLRYVLCTHTGKSCGLWFMMRDVLARCPGPNKKSKYCGYIHSHDAQPPALPPSSSSHKTASRCSKCARVSALSSAMAWWLAQPDGIRLILIHFYCHTARKQTKPAIIPAKPSTHTLHNHIYWCLEMEWTCSLWNKRKRKSQSTRSAFV